MRIVTTTITLKSQRGPEFIDITPVILEHVTSSGIHNGCVVIFTRHTTAAIRINENDPRLIKDLEELLERIAPRSAAYHHNEVRSGAEGVDGEDDANGHAHCQHMLLGSSETVPLIDGKLQLGDWQRIFLVELDRARHREVLAQIIGE